MAENFKVSLPLRTTDDPDPEVSQPLRRSKEKLALVPNLYRAMANVPALLSTYLQGYQLLREKSSFSPAELEVLFLSISRENECQYCVAAHSFLADTASGVDQPVTDAIRDGRPAGDPRLEALRTFAQRMVKARGNPAETDARAFVEAGFTEAQILEVVLAIGVKTLSNYTNHLFDYDVDGPFKGRNWSPGQLETAE